MADMHNSRPEVWYPTETVGREELAAWYGYAPVPPAAGTYTGAASRKTTDKKRRRTKIVALSLCGVLVLASVTTAVSSALRLNRQKTEAEAGASRIESGEDYEEDYRDYFARYYVTTDGSGIKRFPAPEGMEIELRTQSGKPALSLQEIYELVNPAIVGVATYLHGLEYSWGSGVIISPDGYILINTHMIEGGDSAEVILANGERYEALLVGSDSQSDIAVLKVDGHDLPYAELGDSDELRVGDGVAAIGNPLGESYSGTMTNGIISAINRTVSNNGRTMTLLQTNTAINEGSSGGALVNMYGQVVGITNMKLLNPYGTVTVEGMCFAVPTSVVKEVADELLANGAVTGKPSIGIVAGSVSAEAMRVYGLPDGLYVSAVREGSDAKARGLEAGDIIVEVNGAPVSTVAQVNAIKENLSVGDSLTLTVYREGRTFEMEIRLVDETDLLD